MERHAHSVFCDDLRREVGNKFSLMGIYAGDMNISGSLPENKIRLAIVTWASTPHSHPFSSLVLRVMRDDDELTRVDAKLDQLTPMPQEPDADMRMVIMMALELPQLELERDCVLRVWIDADGETLKAGGLRVRFAEAAAPSQ